MSFTLRKKEIVIFAILCIGALFAFQIFVRPALHRTNTLKREVSEKREILSNLQVKSKNYNSLKEQFEQIRVMIESQQKDKKLLSSIEQMQKDCGLLQNVANMSPTTITISDKYEKTNIEIKYNKVTLNQIIQFLLKIETSDLLIDIKSLEIKHNLHDSTLLDVGIQLVNISNIEKD